MITTVSFITANFVARPLGYNMTRGWGQGDRATNDYFRPVETFGERFEALLGEVRAMGFEALDLWLAQLNPSWATEAQIATARSLLDRYAFRVTGLGGWFGATPEEFEATCRLAVALGAPLLGGRTSMLEKDRALVVAALKKHGLRLGLENHPEKSPEEMLAQIGDGGEGTLGTTVDTGWYGTQGMDAVQAIARLADHIVLVHLKDVLAPGAHDTCRYGQGCVPIEACVRTLQQIGYAGPISVEHEPEHHDPTPDVVANLEMLRGWLA